MRITSCGFVQRFLSSYFTRISTKWQVSAFQTHASRLVVNPKQFVAGLFQAAVFARCANAVDFFDAVRQVFQILAVDDDVVVVRSLDRLGEGFGCDERVSFVDEDEAVVVESKLSLSVAPGERRASLRAFERDAAAVSVVVIFLNHLDERCLARGTVAADDGDVPMNREIITDAFVLDDDVLRTFHHAPPSDKASGNRDEFLHAVDGLVGSDGAG